MSRNRLGLLIATLLGVSLSVVAIWFWPTPLPTARHFFFLEDNELRLWARHDQAEKISWPAGDLLKARGSEMALWIENPEQLGPLVFQINGQLSQVEIRSGGKSRNFEPPHPADQTRFFVEWQPENARHDKARPGFFYPLKLSFSTPAESPTVALIGSRAFLDRDIYGVEWLGCGLPESVVADSELLSLVQLRNTSSATWPHHGHARVRLAAHWLDANGESPREAGPRVDLEAAAKPGDEVARWLRVQAPAKAGRYTLEFDLFFEPLVWFSERQAPTCRAEVVVH